MQAPVVLHRQCSIRPQPACSWSIWTVCLLSFSTLPAGHSRHWLEDREGVPAVPVDDVAPAPGQAVQHQKIAQQPVRIISDTFHRQQHTVLQLQSTNLQAPQPVHRRIPNGTREQFGLEEQQQRAARAADLIQPEAAQDPCVRALRVHL
jgi:hypothetical protein